MLTATRSQMSAMLARLPPYSGIMLSISSTSVPSATRRRAIAEPMRPRPPVITARAPVYTSRREFTLPRHRTPQGDLRSPWVIAATLRDWSPRNVTDNVTSLGPIPGGPIASISPVHLLFCREAGTYRHQHLRLACPVGLS